MNISYKQLLRPILFNINQSSLSINTIINLSKYNYIQYIHIHITRIQILIIIPDMKSDNFGAYCYNNSKTKLIYIQFITKSKLDIRSILIEKSKDLIFRIKK